MFIKLILKFKKLKGVLRFSNLLIFKVLIIEQFLPPSLVFSLANQVVLGFEFPITSELFELFCYILIFLEELLILF